MDVWGPYHTKSISGSQYVLTIVDDSSRSVWTFLLAHKSLVPQTLKHFFNLIHNQFSCIVKVVRSDNGTEFVNKACTNMFGELGIIHQKTYPYTPQQNGVVERKHRHLVTTAKSLLIHAGLSKRFWGDSMLMATNLINRLPSPTLKWKTPYEVLYHKPPSYDQLRVFGCLAYVTKLGPRKDKFASRVEKGIFLGYPAG